MSFGSGHNIFLINYEWWWAKRKASKYCDHCRFINTCEFDFDHPQKETSESCCKIILSLIIDGNFKSWEVIKLIAKREIINNILFFIW